LNFKHASHKVTILRPSTSTIAKNYCPVVTQNTAQFTAYKIWQQSWYSMSQIVTFIFVCWQQCNIDIHTNLLWLTNIYQSWSSDYSRTDNLICQINFNLDLLHEILSKPVTSVLS